MLNINSNFVTPILKNFMSKTIFTKNKNTIIIRVHDLIIIYANFNVNVNNKKKTIKNLSV